MFRAGTGVATFDPRSGLTGISAIARDVVLGQFARDYILPGGTAISTNVGGGGIQYVFRDGTASGAILNNGGGELVSAGGSERVYSAGIDDLSVISSGGLEFVYSAGTVSGGTLISGARLTVASGGNVQGGLTISGGTAAVSGSVAAGQEIKFVGAGGNLALDNVPNFAAVIGGFGTGDRFDLGGFAFGIGETVSFAEAASLTSGTLSVVAGSSQAHLTLLGRYATSNFALGSDHGGGTIVTFT